MPSPSSPPPPSPPPPPPLSGSPPPPVRETPLPFAHPHVSVRFGIGGHLVTVLPVVPTEHSSAIVEIHTLKVQLSIVTTSVIVYGTVFHRINAWVFISYKQS